MNVQDSPSAKRTSEVMKTSTSPSTNNSSPSSANCSQSASPLRHYLPPTCYTIQDILYPDVNSSFDPNEQLEDEMASAIHHHHHQRQHLQQPHYVNGLMSLESGSLIFRRRTIITTVNTSLVVHFRADASRHFSRYQNRCKEIINNNKKKGEIVTTRRQLRWRKDWCNKTSLPHCIYSSICVWAVITLLDLIQLGSFRPYSSFALKVMLHGGL